MSLSNRTPAPIAILLLLAGCGSDPPSSLPPGEEPNTLTFNTGPFEMPAGESFECFYTDITTERELSVVSASAVQGAGGHHVTLYYVDNPRPVGHSKCDGKTEMSDWHFVVGASGEGNQLGNMVQLAEGLAIKIPANKQLMVQAHYINTSGAPRTYDDTIKVFFTEPANVEAYASDFVVIDNSFEIPPESEHETVMTCTVSQDVKLTMLLGHMHEQGEYYKLEKVDEDGATIKVLYEEEWSPSFTSHPPIDLFTTDAPLVLAAGTQLRQTCRWNNTSKDVLMFPTEMCIGFGYYFPGESRLTCESP